MKDKVELLVITTSIFAVSEEDQRLIREVAPQVVLTVMSDKEVTPDIIGKAQIIFGWMTKEQISQTKSLKWLHLPSAGADGYTTVSDY